MTTTQSTQTDLAIAQGATLLPIDEVAATLAIPKDALYPFGHHVAKLEGDLTAQLMERPRGKLILVTATNPTPAGEGKTTTTIGLGDGLRRIGKDAVICLREPSLGPCFGMKGGATGGGHAQVAPMEAINLHFTGDFHALTTAHNLLAALLDNHLYWRKTPTLDSRRLTWRRVLDVNDRSLRQVATGLGAGQNGVVRESGFDITVASELMAIFCLAHDLRDLTRRIGAMVVGETAERRPVTVAELGFAGALTALLKDAFRPNLVQTLEHTPALIHGGPFANIAHGCNSLVATQTALGLGEYAVTEAGFGADLGAEKFIHIKCRQSGLVPAAVVVVATVRALKMHGGISKDRLDEPDEAAVERGLANLGRHLENLANLGLSAAVAINHFPRDTAAEQGRIVAFCRARGVEAVVCTHWAEGGRGAEALARDVVELAERGGTTPSSPRFLYPLELPLVAKIEAVAKGIYRAGEVVIEPRARRQLARFENQGYGHLPVCMAKTQYSFSSDPTLLGAPENHTLGVREVRLSAGAGFVVAICGDLMTMPGLPKEPAALAIGLDDRGQIKGLF
ncbi:MAG: formate--tetrahydrofolate ligase [Candidatus Competibacterales bacterium]